MKRVNCEGVGDDDGFFEINTNQKQESPFDLYVEGYGNTYEQAISALSKQMKFVESKSEVEWSNDILAFGSGEMGHKTHHKYRILKAK